MKEKMAVRYDLNLGLQTQFTLYQNCHDRNLITLTLCTASPGRDVDAATGGDYGGAADDDGARARC